MQPLEIVIVGAGIGGLSCAIASRKQGLNVVVLEKAEKLTPVRPVLIQCSLLFSCTLNGLYDCEEEGILGPDAIMLLFDWCPTLSNN